MVLENNSHQDGNFGESGIRDPSSNILQFLDSLDGYLTLFDSLSSTLRQGWIELASARHSMGSSRITSVLLDLKPHSAATTIYVDQMEDETLSEETVATFNMVKEPHFTLSKWASISDGKCYSGEIEVDEELHKKSGSSQLRRRGPSQSSDVKENNSAIDGSSFSVDDQIPVAGNFCGHLSMLSHMKVDSNVVDGIRWIAMRAVKEVLDPEAEIQITLRLRGFGFSKASRCTSFI